MRVARQLIERVEDLPATPKVIPSMLALLKNEQASANELAELIQVAPSLAAQLVRLSNSSYYSFPERCATVLDAVSRLGLEESVKLVSGLVSAELSGRDLQSYDMLGEELWKGSVACALASQILAERFGLDTAEPYTCGLFHNLGKLAIAQVVGSEYGEVYDRIESDESISQAEAEREVFGCAWPEVGAELLRAWGFPDSFVEAVRWQLDPEESFDGPFKTRVSLLHMALFIVSGVGRAFGRDGYAFEVSSNAFRELELEDGQLEDIMIEVHVRLQDVESMLRS